MNLRRGGVIALLALAALGACRERAAPRETRTLLFDDAPNLLALDDGVVVTHRTGENTLLTSAIMAVDGDPRTFWQTPPGDPLETMTVALPATAEIARIGIHTGATRREQAPDALRFEASLNGSDFTVLGEVPIREKGETWVDVEPARAGWLRISTTGALHRGSEQVRVVSALASGTRLADPVRSDIEGTWKINGALARFSSSGSTIRGVVAQAEPVSLEGGWDGLLFRLAWVRGREYGVLIGTIDPPAEHFNGVLWHVDTARAFFDEAWFGERAEGEISLTGTGPMPRFLEQEGRYPLYGLEFDGSRLTPESGPAVVRLADFLTRNAPKRFRLVAHHLGPESEQEDRRIAGARIDSLRASLVAAGLDPARVEFVAAGRRALLNEFELPWAPLQARLNNRIDLELVRDRRSNGG